jgi:hypothetical protein
VNRAVAQRAKAGWLRRNSALIPGSLLRGASLTFDIKNKLLKEHTYFIEKVKGDFKG